MKVVITSATEIEALQIKQKIKPLFAGNTNKLQILFHISGVGILASAFSLTQLILQQKPELIIQAGIAGTFNKDTPLGKVVVVKEEILADTGVEEGGLFKDIFDLNLAGANTHPFTNGKLINPSLHTFNFLHLPEVTAVTVNEVTTQANRIEQIITKYNPETESMEGASLHYCCLQTSIPFLQVRAISNYVGERDKTKWQFKKCFDNLGETVFNYIQHLSLLNK